MCQKLQHYIFSNERGFTLVETIMTLAIVVIVSSALFAGVQALYHYNSYALAQANQVNAAQQSMDRLVRDIREMAYADDGAFPLVIMKPNEIGFYSDVDHDSSVEYVEYEISSTTLERRVYRAAGNPPVYDTTPDLSRTLSDSVQNIALGTSTFSYYDKNGLLATASSTVTDIVYVKAKIIINIDPINHPGGYTLVGSASLRNLKEEI